MKNKKFKLEKKTIEEVRKSLYTLALRAKILNAYIIQNYIEESFYNTLLVRYQSVIFSFIAELNSISSENSNIFITKEQLERFNNYKKSLSDYEEIINSSNILSLRVH